MSVHSSTSLVPLVVLGILVALAALAGAVWYLVRRAALRSWQRFAAEIDGDFRAKNSLSPERVFGTLHNRPYVLETGISHEDDAPYYHTRGAFPIKNPANFIMGVRRKSMLEEMQTLREKTPTDRIDLNDPDFERRFFLLSNAVEHAVPLLGPEVRRELSRYPDIEIYVRINEIEWRRAGEEGDMRVIRRLNAMLATMAENIDALPKRPISLTERLAAEELIAKGM